MEIAINLFYFEQKLEIFSDVMRRVKGRILKCIAGNVKGKVAKPVGTEMGHDK